MPGFPIRLATRSGRAERRLALSSRDSSSPGAAGTVMTLHAHYRGASLILTAGATVAYYCLLRLELAARPARCNPMDASEAKLSLWLCVILLLGALSQQTAFAQSAPSITQQPQGQNLLAGTDATFTIGATGQTPLS